MRRYKSNDYSRLLLKDCPLNCGITAISTTYRDKAFIYRSLIVLFIELNLKSEVMPILIAQYAAYMYACAPA